MRRFEPPEALEERLRGLRARTHLPVHHRDLEDRSRLPFPAERRELPFVKGHEVIPHLALGEDVDERARRLAVPRLDVEHFGVDVLRPLGSVHLSLQNAREPEQPRRPVVFRRRRLRPLLEQNRELLPSPLGAEDPLEDVEGTGPLRIDRHRFAKPADDLV